MEKEISSGLKKILIVEDEESNFELLKAMLRKVDADLYWARNGKVAIELCNKLEFSLILMDIKMPGMDGYDAVNFLRDKGIKTPVIAQTAYARLEDEKFILSHGFDAYISKPIKQNMFESILEKYL